MRTSTFTMVRRGLSPTTTEARRDIPAPTIAHKKGRHPNRMTALQKSGGHGTRTRNRLPGTTFPVWPLAIRLPSESNL
jgi:hypothetical protein